jgi:MarR-like DNA-binding transcriptional regulator SgrR of sgrS sRNA
LRAPVPDLATQLSLPQTAIVKGGKPVGEKPAGSGPYLVESFDKTRKKLQLRAFDEHVLGRPYVDALILTWYDTTDAEARRFETGKAHVSARGAGAFAGSKPAFRISSVDGPPSILAFIGFGRAHQDITDDKSFRRALDLALARGGLAAINAGERVVPTRSPSPVEAGGRALDAVGRASDTAAAQAQLAIAARRVPALAAAKLPSVRLEILVEDTRPDDREIAERVVLALDKLGISATIVPLTSHAMRDRVAKGTCDLWIGQLAEPLAMAPTWWAAAFALGNDDWPVAQMQAGSLDVAVADREFAARLPIVPLMFRSVRMWHPTNLHGLGFDTSGRPSYADIHVFGPLASGKAPVKGTP